jgi:hypothetical protein
MNKKSGKSLKNKRISCQKKKEKRNVGEKKGKNKSATKVSQSPQKMISTESILDELANNNNGLGQLNK